MSVAAMVDNEVRRAEGLPPKTAALAATAAAAPAADTATAAKQGTRPGDVVGGIVSYVPVEAVAAYLALLPFMDPSAAGETGPVADLSYSGRWYLVLGVGALTFFYAVFYRSLATKNTDACFKFPWIPVTTAMLGFVAFVFASPNSPFNDFSFYTPELGVVAGGIAATLIASVGLAIGETLTYGNAEEAKKEGDEKAKEEKGEEKAKEKAADQATTPTRPVPLTVRATAWIALLAARLARGTAAFAESPERPLQQ